MLQFSSYSRTIHLDVLLHAVYCNISNCVGVSTSLTLIDDTMSNLQRLGTSTGRDSHYQFNGHKSFQMESFLKDLESFETFFGKFLEILESHFQKLFFID